MLVYVVRLCSLGHFMSKLRRLSLFLQKNQFDLYTPDPIIQTDLLVDEIQLTLFIFSYKLQQSLLTTAIVCIYIQIYIQIILLRSRVHFITGINYSLSLFHVF